MQFDNDKSDGLQIFPYQISGKKPKYIDNESGLVYKLSSKAEISFYERIRNSCTTDDCYGLKQFLPTYLGVSRGMYLKQDKDPTNNQLNESSSSVSG